MLATLLSLTLSCLSVGDVDDRAVHSPNKTFTLSVGHGALTLFEGERVLWPPPPPGPGVPPPREEDYELAKKKTRWRVDAPPDATNYVVSDDGSWVAVIHELPRLMDPERAVVTLFDAKGAPRDFDVLPLLTEDERKVLPRTDCGALWFAAARPSGSGVEIDLNQGALAANPKPRWLATVRIDLATGAMSRVASPMPKPEKQADQPAPKKKPAKKK